MAALALATVPRLDDLGQGAVTIPGASKAEPRGAKTLHPTDTLLWGSHPPPPYTVVVYGNNRCCFTADENISAV